HIAPLIRPDGTAILYLRTSTFVNTSQHSNPGSFYDDFTGDLVLVDADDTDGSSARALLTDCRSIFEWRVAAWIDNDNFAYIGQDHDGYVYTISTQESRKIFNYPRDAYGALPNPQLSHCIDGGNRLYRIDNPGPGGTCTQLHDYDGCQGSLSRDGTIAYRTQGQKPRDLMAMPLDDIPSEWSMVPPERFPSSQNYLYYPRLSWSQQFAACGASDGSHSHWDADYDIFVLPVDPTTKRPAGDAVKYCFGTTQSGVGLDSWPDVWVSTENVPPEAGSVMLTPALAGATVGNPVAFTASIKDQFGQPYDGPMAWSVNGGGSMSPAQSSQDAATHAAQFLSDGTAGTFTVTATSGDLYATASVEVIDPAELYIRINCGAVDDAVSGWASCDGYVSGGDVYEFGGTPNVTSVANAAPAQVYQTVRHRDHNYSFPQVPDGNYTVRLHFYDEHEEYARAMDYTIEGEKVLDDFDIVAEAGGPGNAIVKDFPVTVDDGNGIQIVAEQDGGNDVFEAGIEIFPSNGGPHGPCLTLLTPGGQTLRMGDVLSVSWETDGTCGNDVDVFLIIDELDVRQLNTDNSIETGDDNTGRFEWTIAQFPDGTSPISDNVVLRIEDYHDPSNNDRCPRFSIVPENARAAWRNAGSADVRIAVTGKGTGFLGIQVPWHMGEHSVRIVNLRGETVAALRGTGPASHTVDLAGHAGGTYVILISGEVISVIRKIIVP
ncbi:MAG: hypothetical protein GF418_12020, partial [Chitinivibrionales bacterium]|nr:hypothetical protein [Chitinivibrionales bacterium]MBD3396344.1 hypothetical protein [Chitinivibrionales bacterium]